MPDNSRETKSLRDYNASLPYVAGPDGTSNPVGPSNPLPTRSEEPLEVYAPQLLTPGVNQALTVPVGANRAVVTLTSGTGRAGLMTATGAGTLTEGAQVTVRGAQLAALRVTVDAGGSARADYWRV